MSVFFFSGKTEHFKRCFFLEYTNSTLFSICNHKEMFLSRTKIEISASRQGKMLDATVATSKIVTRLQMWWKLSQNMLNHERSEEHLHCLEKWKIKLTPGLLWWARRKKSGGTYWTDWYTSHCFLPSKICHFIAISKINLHWIKRACLGWLKCFLNMIQCQRVPMRLKQSTCKPKASVSHLAPERQKIRMSLLMSMQTMWRRHLSRI